MDKIIKMITLYTEKKGMERGVKQGTRDTIHKIDQNLFNFGMSMEKISKSTRLSMSDLKKINQL